ncbi:HAD family hydrolase [Adhaeribacter rhizoryzae]|uniref:Beta-phosphoglucomutase n=1 Tax=Adhaeribacter rhizoryzae TaxID=2607907 RepID=A0A5M6CZ36_9BACT|nr:HAD family phosphatase [Adhaeribacter rhizoryzae]KAA5538569.1 HAD family phosphatase [Adhaeribacter rhizoryzae]
MNITPQALIFDLNGTMIDDMHFHAKAWFQILNNDLGAALTWDEVKVQMYGKNSEVLDRIFGKGKFTVEQVQKLSVEKERRYQQEYFPHLQLIAGLANFLENARQANIKMAIGSAAIPFNIDFVLDNLNIRHYFEAIVSADDVTDSKPDPETFLKAAQLLGVEPANCVVFEDAPKGVEAAQNAGMASVVLTTAHTQEEFSQYFNILRFVQDYNNPFIAELLPVRV